LPAPPIGFITIPARMKLEQRISATTPILRHPPVLS